jgi:hypothetical protein
MMQVPEQIEKHIQGRKYLRLVKEKQAKKKKMSDDSGGDTFLPFLYFPMGDLIF